MIRPTTILAFLLIVLVIALGVYFVQNSNSSGGKWSCSESGCKFVENGDYNTKEKCQKECSRKKKKKVTFFDE
jgi:hypothetical protein